VSKSPELERLVRSLPSVSSVLATEDVGHWLAELPRTSVVGAVQSAIDACRSGMLAGSITEPVDLGTVIMLAEQELVERSTPSVRRVLNATGVVLHTGLGRAALCEAAIDAIVDGAHGYCSLELDLATGKRGKRSAHVSGLLEVLTGAEAATVVNNNAAATLLILSTFAEGRRVVVSRGELVEIGGSYRLPDIMRAGRATLHEVGTTNRTRLGDYEQAIGEETAMLLRVHTSNYRIVGFTEGTPIRALAELAHEHGLIAVDDLGSGALLDLSSHGLPAEPCVRDSIEAGADLVCFSADKLVGGPQAGIIVGKRDLIARVEASPLMRTYRVGKLTLLALDATLRHYLEPDTALEQVPALAMLSLSSDELAARARALSEMLRRALPGGAIYEHSDVSYAGGGSMPGRELETVVVQWRPSHAPVAEVASALRRADVPVIARVRDDAICFDVRTLHESDMEVLVDSVRTAVLDTSDDSGDGVGLPVL